MVGIAGDVGVKNLALGEDAVPVRLYRPAGSAPSRVIVYAHGGGFSWGTLEDYDVLARNLLQATGAAVMSVDYRLAPAHPFPAALDDLCGVVLWTGRNLTAAAAPGAAIFVAGDSAGAALAAGVAQRMRDTAEVSLAGQLLLYPMIEFHDRTPPEFHRLAERFAPSFETIKGAWDAYLPETDKAPPAYAVPTRTTNLGGLCPAFVVLAENDPLRFEGAAYAGQLAKSGVSVQCRTYPGVAHGFLGEENTGAVVAAALADIGAWIRERPGPAVDRSLNRH